MGSESGGGPDSSGGWNKLSTGRGGSYLGVAWKVEDLLAFLACCLVAIRIALSLAQMCFWVCSEAVRDLPDDCDDRGVEDDCDEAEAINSLTDTHDVDGDNIGVEDWRRLRTTGVWGWLTGVCML